MAGNVGGFEDDPLNPGCYSELLCGDEIPGLDTDTCFGFISSSFSSDDHSNVNAPKMLCFGDYANQCNGKKTGRGSGPDTCMDSSSLSSINDTKICSLPNSSSKKRKGSGIQNPNAQNGAPVGSQRNSKKPRPENSTVGGHAKVVKKEKLGERITALQQLVSPFGKTDTASVLHEALGYIRFLHDQVQVLCSPYLQCLSSSSDPPKAQDDREMKKANERTNDDLRSRGLCLVPVDLTMHVAESNGADMWSSTAITDTVTSS